MRKIRAASSSCRPLRDRKVSKLIGSEPRNDRA
jgi:hypothetical protein